MRRIKLKLSPSLEQEDITQTLEDALQEEKGEVSTDVTPTENTDQSTEVTEVAETETSIVDTDPTDNEVIDSITDVVVDAVEGETSESPAASFASKIKESFDAAVEKGFTGTFDDFLVTLTDNIAQKESSSTVNTNPLGTTDGSGDVTVPESEVSEIEESAETSEEVETVEKTEDSDAAEVTETVDEVETPEAEITETDTDVSEDSSIGDSDSGEAPETTEDATEEESAEESEEVTEADTNLNGDEVPEGEGEEETPKADEVEDPEGTDDESLTEYAEGIKDDDEDDEDDEMVEEALDTSERLGRIAEIVKEAAEEAKEGDGDDVNESLAKIAELATECLQDKVGIAPNERITFSNESFNDKAGVMYRYEVSLESVTNSIRKVWESIVKFIKDMIAKLKVLFKKGDEKVNEAKKRASKFFAKNKAKIASLGNKTIDEVNQEEEKAEEKETGSAKSSEKESTEIEEDKNTEKEVKEKKNFDSSRYDDLVSRIYCDGLNKQPFHSIYSSNIDIWEEVVVSLLSNLQTKVDFLSELTINNMGSSSVTNKLKEYNDITSGINFNIKGLSENNSRGTRFENIGAGSTVKKSSKFLMGDRAIILVHSPDNKKSKIGMAYVVNKLDKSNVKVKSLTGDEIIKVENLYTKNDDIRVDYGMDLNRIYAKFIDIHEHITGMINQFTENNNKLFTDNFNEYLNLHKSVVSLIEQIRRTIDEVANGLMYAALEYIAYSLSE